MESVLQWLAPVLGLFLGTLLISRVGSWVEAIVTTVQNARRDATNKDAQRTLVWPLAAVAILHSGPWLLGVTVYWAYYVLTAPHAPEWLWFFGGVAAAPVVWTPVLIFMHRRGRRLEAERKTENAD